MLLSSKCCMKARSISAMPILRSVSVNSNQLPRPTFFWTNVRPDEINHSVFVSRYNLFCIQIPNNVKTHQSKSWQVVPCNDSESQISIFGNAFKASNRKEAWGNSCLQILDIGGGILQPMAHSPPADICLDRDWMLLLLLWARDLLLAASAESQSDSGIFDIAFCMAM